MTLGDQTLKLFRKFRTEKEKTDFDKILSHYTKVVHGNLEHASRINPPRGDNGLVVVVGNSHSDGQPVALYSRYAVSDKNSARNAALSIIGYGGFTGPVVVIKWDSRRYEEAIENLPRYIQGDTVDSQAATRILPVVKPADPVYSH